jgi:hypothetical protein
MVFLAWKLCEIKKMQRKILCFVDNNQKLAYKLETALSSSLGAYVGFMDIFCTLLSDTY